VPVEEAFFSGSAPIGWRWPRGMSTIPFPTFTDRLRDPAMAKGKKKLEVIHLVCEETGDQNYTLRRKTGGEKLKVKKYSPRLRKHTVHNEKRK
jgi:large subunit ribosomal protein L33